MTQRSLLPQIDLAGSKIASSVDFARPKRWPVRGFVSLVCLAATLGFGGATNAQEPAPGAGEPALPTASRGQVTFNRDIAPLIFKHCAGCHHPGQAAPFSLLDYADVKKRSRQIVEVTQKRYMPPWLPEPGHGEFTGVRRLSIAEIGLIQQWASAGGPEGDPADLPAAPKWHEGWELGPPDLVLNMTNAYLLPADGKDIYRNFVLPAAVSTGRYVRAIEFKPGNPKIVHHAFVKVDKTRQSRRLDEGDAAPGFAGMTTPAVMPGGHFLTWQPGKSPSVMPHGLSWRLDPGSDVVFEMHLRPTGKPELLQSSVGLYFTDEAPTNTCFKFLLTSFLIDIPPGATDYVVEDSYALPVEAQVLAVFPHAHYLGKELKGWATLPDGSRKPLLLIKQWDFNWQGDYRYREPVLLPKGTVLSMRYTFDNSTNNLKNPNQPPQRVVYGSQSSDEMAELWFQIVTRNRDDLARIAEDHQAKLAKIFLAYDEYRLQLNPGDAKALIRVGMRRLTEARYDDALRHFEKAKQLAPADDEPPYCLGLLWRLRGRLPEARQEFEAALRLNPANYKAHGNLGLIRAAEGNAAAAESHFRSALKINPDDELARASLQELLSKSKRAPR